MGQCKDWASVNGCPHGHVCGLFGGSHPYLRCNPSLLSDLLSEKLNFVRSNKLNQFDAPFCDGRLTFSFFLMSNFHNFGLF